MSFLFNHKSPQTFHVEEFRLNIQEIQGFQRIYSLYEDSDLPTIVSIIPPQSQNGKEVDR